MVENSLQDYQAQAEDVKVSGEADLCILARIFWHVVNRVLCKAGKRRTSRPLSSTNNLQISQACICILVEDVTQVHNSAPHQSLLEVQTSVKSMTTTLPLSCSKIVIQKNMIKCTSWKPIASQAVSALLLLGEHSIGPPLSLVVGVVFGCIWSMVRNYSAVGKKGDRTCLWGCSALDGARLRTLCLHTWRMLRDTICGGCSSYQF